MTTVLYDYWQSSASYRVRIALNLIDQPANVHAVDLLTAEHKDTANLARNPQGLVPTLEIDGTTLTQSLAILEYLDETRATAGFLPKDPVGRAHVRAMAYMIAMEIHPICNQSVARFATDRMGDTEMQDWMQTFITKGLSGLERMLQTHATGRYCYGDTVTMADICLVPQIYNADRWQVDLTPMPRCRQIADLLNALPAFAAAHPQRVRPPT